MFNPLCTILHANCHSSLVILFDKCIACVWATVAVVAVEKKSVNISGSCFYCDWSVWQIRVRIYVFKRLTLENHS